MYGRLSASGGPAGNVLRFEPGMGSVASTSAHAPHASRDLALDRLEASPLSLEVVVLENAAIDGCTACGPSRPHRHDYHELIWASQGASSHRIDGDAERSGPVTMTLIGRGQVHVFEAATGLSGAIIRFGDELLHEGSAARANPVWLLGGDPRTLQVPAAEASRVDSVTRTLAAETLRPSDARSVDLYRHLLLTLLLWVERWVDAARSEQRGAADASDQLHRRFVAVLERDFAHHQEVSHYADELRVPAAALSRALAEATGRTTKALITDRVMVEAARLLRFTDFSVGEVALRVGLGDRLYFSRAFKRHYGEAPAAYRERLRQAV
jgi:AraC family transcriptional regulator, transcriptional activator of pobA